MRLWELDIQVLYLDFDGVLHPSSVCRFRKQPSIRLVDAPGHVLFENCSLLETLLDPYPNLRIVLSTTWVRILDFRRAKQRLTQPLQERVIGATFHSRYHDAQKFALRPRYLQILDDVARRRPDRWLAVDDDPEHNFEDWLVPYLVQPPGAFGIAHPGTEAALRRRLEEVFGSDGPSSFPLRDPKDGDV